MDEIAEIMSRYSEAYISDSLTNLKTINNKISLNKIKKNIPLGKLGNPQDLSGILIYLCSESSSFVNGSNIVIDGGWSSW